jgi:hypothetical protein
MTAFPHAALPGIVALAVVPISAIAKPSIEVLFEVTLDIDHDGKPDRAVAVEETETGQGGLYIYLGAGDKKTDLSRQPSFLKKAVTEGSAGSKATPAEHWSSPPVSAAVPANHGPRR